VIVRSGYAKRRRNGSTRAYRRARASILGRARVCAYCGQPSRPDDPFVSAHVIPYADGGDVLQAAHRSCNGRLGRL
jgi:5-methylcytosine-specific restriction endonuclease McrA